MKFISFLLAIITFALTLPTNRGSRQLDVYLEDSCYSCLAQWPKFYFCSHNTPTRKFGTCCSLYSSSFLCQNLDLTTSCSDGIQSAELSHSKCLGVTPMQCGNVGTLEQAANFQNQSVSIINVLQADLTACYWGFTLNSSWSSNSTIYVYLTSIAGFNISVANGSDITTSKTLYTNILKSTVIAVTGSSKVFMIAVPLKVFQNQLTFSFRVDGTYIEPVIIQTSFWLQNMAMLISVSVIGAAIILILAIVCVIIKKRKLIQIDPQKMKKLQEERKKNKDLNNSQSRIKEADNSEKEQNKGELYSTISKNVNLAGLIAADGVSSSLDTGRRRAANNQVIDLSNLGMSGSQLRIN